MEFQPLGEDHRAAVADLFARAADYVLLETGLPPGDEAVEDFLHGAPPGIDPATSLRVGVAGRVGLAGIAEMAFGYPAAGDAYIGLLLLDPAERGQGLGTRMVAALVRAAQARGATRMFVAVLEENPRGMAFWLREGFQPEGVKPGMERGVRVHRLHRLVRAI